MDGGRGSGIETPRVDCCVKLNECGESGAGGAGGAGGEGSSPFSTDANDIESGKPPKAQ